MEKQNRIEKSEHDKSRDRRSKRGTKSRCLLCTVHAAQKNDDRRYDPIRSSLH